jgi:hypothetical protein
MISATVLPTMSPAEILSVDVVTALGIGLQFDEHASRLVVRGRRVIEPRYHIGQRPARRARREHPAPDGVRDQVRPYRNPRWPVMRWQSEDHLWPDGMHTTEWFADVSSQDAVTWSAFQERWHEQLKGGIESDEPLTGC